MFSTWTGKLGYLAFMAVALIVTHVCTRPGLKESLNRPIVPGFAPNCTRWQAWKMFCSFFWERVLLTGVTVACAIRLYMGQWTWVDAVIPIGVAIVFPFQEYLSHKLLLHHRPIRIFGREIETLIALVHRVHHRDPWHMERAINPPVALVLYITGIPILFFPFLPPPQAMTGVASSWLVLLLYEWIHLLIHTSYIPKNPLYKRIWRNHRLHHFKSEHYWFNVSTYGVDLLLGTQPPPNTIPTSPTCLTLDEREAEPGAAPPKQAAPENSAPEQPVGQC